MDKKLELSNRILEGHRKVNDLSELLGMIPAGSRRDELGSKLTRMLLALEALEDGFIQLYPGACPFKASQPCRNPNKGCYPCYSCDVGLNAILGSRGKLM